MLSRGQKRELGYPVSDIGGQFAFDRFSVGLGLVDPTDRFSPSGLNVSEVRPDPTGMGRNMPRELEAQLNALGISPEDAAQLTPDELDLIINDPTRAMRKRTAEMPELPDTAPDTAINRIVRPGQVARGKIEDIEQKGSATSRAEAIRLMTGDDAYSGPDESPVAQEDDTDNTPPKKDDPRTTLDEARKVVESKDFDFDTSYEKAVERFGRILGDESNEDKRKKALANMAMIGLAIAAGQSPDALTNIAQGALVGMKGIQEAEAADKQSLKEIKLAALKATMDQETQIRKAEAEAARDKNKFNQQMQLEILKAGLQNEGGTKISPLDPFAESVLDQAKTLLTGGLASTYDDAIRQAYKRVSVLPGYSEMKLPDVDTLLVNPKILNDVNTLKARTPKIPLETIRKELKLKYGDEINPSLYGL
jgi:hypothetical protein